ncbi:hypothetical protein BSNK01_04770 [Bacillaceae bacterium]
MNFSQELTPYTAEGRELIHKRLQGDVEWELFKLMKSRIPNATVQYMDNRLSRYSMKMGRCEITGMFLFAEDVHCYHNLPKHLGGTDEFGNLRIVHKDVHKLIHATNPETIESLLDKIKPTGNILKKINQYRKKAGLELIG